MEIVKETAMGKLLEDIEAINTIFRPEYHPEDRAYLLWH